MGQKHAFGRYRSPSGVFYEGEYHRGKRQGHGRYTFKSGNYYDGPYKNNMQHGIAKFYFKESGTVKIGEWQNDQRVQWVEEPPATEAEEAEAKAMDTTSQTDISPPLKHKIYLVHEQYDIVDTEIRLKHNKEFLNLFVKPFGIDGTKVTICVVGTDL